MSQIGDKANEIVRDFLSLPGTTASITVDEYLKIRQRAEIEIAKEGNTIAPPVTTVTPIVAAVPKNRGMETKNGSPTVNTRDTTPKNKKGHRASVVIPLEDEPETEDDQLNTSGSAFDILRSMPDAWN